jgi:hypothetical protein
LIKDDNLVYDPKQIEIKTVNAEKGVAKEDGWEEIKRDASGTYATLLKRK